MAMSSNVYLISIIVIMASVLSCPSLGLTIGGYNINRVIIDDVVYCYFNGQSTPVSNATVFVTCAGSTATLAQAVTDIDGTFTIVLSLLQTLLFNPSYCGAGVNLPVGSCGLVAPENVFYGTLALLDIIQINTTNVAIFRTNFNNQ